MVNFKSVEIIKILSSGLRIYIFLFYIFLYIFIYIYTLHNQTKKKLDVYQTPRYKNPNNQARQMI